MDYLILEKQIKECYKSFSGFSWPVSDCIRLLENFMITYNKYRGHLHKPISNKDMKYILSALQSYDIAYYNDIIELYFESDFNHYSIYHFISRGVRWNLNEQKKRGKRKHGK